MGLITLSLYKNFEGKFFKLVSYANIFLQNLNINKLETVLEAYQDKLKAFETGADDYVTKPFSQKELNARIKSLLRRAKPLSSTDVVEFKDLKIDRLAKRVYRNDKEIILGPTEFKLLDFFIKNPKR